MNMFRTLGYWSCTLAACCLAFSLTSCHKGKGGAAASADEQDEIYSLQTGNYFLPEGSPGGQARFTIDGIDRFELELVVSEETKTHWKAYVNRGYLETPDLTGLGSIICNISTGTVEHAITTESVIELKITLQGSGEIMGKKDDLDIGMTLHIDFQPNRREATIISGTWQVTPKTHSDYGFSNSQLSGKKVTIN